MKPDRALIYDNGQWLVARIRESTDPDEIIVASDTVGDFLEWLEDEERGGVFAQTPALEEWRKRTLEDREADPLTRAAAWELTALALDQNDAHDLAAKCRANAAYALGIRPWRPS